MYVYGIIKYVFKIGVEFVRFYAAIKRRNDVEVVLENLKNFFQLYFVDSVKSITPLDALDIILLAVVLYFVYVFIRDKRAGKLLVGLGCILILTVVSDFLDLHALSFIFSDFRQIGVIAILILFQPELRAALEKVGGMPSSGIRNITAESRDASSMSKEIDALCSAVSDLSRDKVGALIVIERTTKLGEYIKSGVPIDAALTPHLVRNIFFDKAPLHDGAAIIRAGRICAAGCFLPLSTNEEIDKDLGTRHRAGIGMSELSDAIVIIVSEETGIISVAIDGKLERNYNYTSLKQVLNKKLAQSGQNTPTKKLSKKERSKSDDN